MINSRPEWIYMPLPRMHEHHTAFRAFLATIRAPDVNLPKNADAMKLRFSLMVVPNTHVVQQDVLPRGP